MLVHPTVKCAAAALLARAQCVCFLRLGLNVGLPQVDGRWCRVRACAGFRTKGLRMAQ
jgi:hypothetical protein